MAPVTRKDIKVVQDVFEILLNTMPKSEAAVHNIAFTYGLISRDAGIPEEKATEFILAWSERLRALPNFRELFPIYKKPSFMKYQMKYAIKSSYLRTKDKPSSQWFEALTGEKAPAAFFWDKSEEEIKKKKAERKTGTGSRRPRKTAAKPD